MERKTFVFYADWFESLEDFETEFRQRIIEAIVQYALYGIVPTDKMILYSPFAVIRKQIDRDSEKYQAMCLRNKEKGKLGGRPRKETQEDFNESQQNPKNPTAFLETQKTQVVFQKPNESQQNPKNLDNDNDNDNDNDIVSEYKYSSTIISEANASVSTDVDAATAKKEDFFKRVFNLWNDKMQGKAIPNITKMTPKRKLMVNARRSEYGEQAILNAIQKVADSEYLNQGHTWFSFDWMFLPNNFPKVLEGNYDNAKQQYNPNNTTSGYASAEDVERQQRTKEFMQHIIGKIGDNQPSGYDPIW